MLTMTTGVRSCGYVPDVDAALTGVRDCPEPRVLVVGPGVADYDVVGMVLKAVPAEAVRLPEGFYWFDHRDRALRLVVMSGDVPQDPERVSAEDFGETDHPCSSDGAGSSHQYRRGDR